ncbi:MAG: hypothetical protein AB3N21_19690 [Ruegeria sp.]|uniref:hypothetical protein n=1 Tax=Ruegeria sp. TaxID=1879320 RepID=UPI00349E9C96
MTIELYSEPADFEAEIAILSSDQGGRNLPVHNFIRWDFGYAEDASPKEIYMIYPKFLDKDGLPIPEGISLDGTLMARMHIVVRETTDYHRARISVGTRFNCHEGGRVVARGIVTKLLALEA